MKLFKLIKSIDYIAYPVNREVIRISESLNDDFGKVKELIISTIIGVLFDKMTFSNMVIGLLVKSKWSLLREFAHFLGAKIIIATLVAILCYIIIKLSHNIKNKTESNKNTIEKRDLLVDDFYHILIPSQIEAKSIIEQVQEVQGKDKNTILLLLFQAEHEIDNTMQYLREMRLLEVDGKGQLTEDSCRLIERIGRPVYVELLRGILFNLSNILKILEDDYSEQSELKSKIELKINSMIFSIPELKKEYEPLRERIAQNQHKLHPDAPACTRFEP